MSMHTMNRRALVAGAATLPVVSIPAVAQCVLQEVDPIFALIQRHKEAFTALMTAHDATGGNHSEDLDIAENAAVRAMLQTEPTTIAGAAALVAYVHECERNGVALANLCLPLLEMPEWARPDYEGYSLLLRTLDRALAAMVR
jgi:hypothetical protein